MSVKVFFQNFGKSGPFFVRFGASEAERSREDGVQVSCRYEQYRVRDERLKFESGENTARRYSLRPNGEYGETQLVVSRLRAVRSLRSVHRWNRSFQGLLTVWRVD